MAKNQHTQRKLLYFTLIRYPTIKSTELSGTDNHDYDGIAIRNFLHSKRVLWPQRLK